MSTLEGRASNGMPEHFVFPSSHHSSNKRLCINIHNKSYALASSKTACPPNITILEGLAFIADNFYDYENPWHGLNAIAAFFAWMKENGCQSPMRFLVFKNGEVVKRVGSWVYNLMKAGLREGGVVVESLGGRRRAVVCFERAVVMRRGLGGMAGEKRRALFEMMRCRAWRYCGATSRRDESGVVSVSIVGREGKRRFKNEKEIRGVMQSVCDKVKGLQVRVGPFQEHELLRAGENDEEHRHLGDAHGAQLTNMMFMEKGSSVMEMFPTGWLESAGIGQYVHRWFASWSEMSCAGAWRDPDSLNCSAVAHDGEESRRS